MPYNPNEISQMIDDLRKRIAAIENTLHLTIEALQVSSRNDYETAGMTKKAKDSLP